MAVTPRFLQDPEPTPVDEKSTQSITSEPKGPQESSVKGMTKQDDEIWQSVIRMAEHHLARETTIARLENIRAVLAFIQQHGYPYGNEWDEESSEVYVWEMDGLARSTTKDEFKSQPWSSPPPGFDGRGREGYCVVSSIVGSTLTGR